MQFSPELLSNPVIITNEEGAAMYRNPAASALMQIRYEEKTIGINELPLFLFEHKENISAFRLSTSDDRYFQFNLSGSEGQYIFTGTDITAHIRKQLFYEDLLDHVPADLGVFSTEYKYLYVNAVGIKSEELRKWIIGKTDRDYCHYRNKPQDIAEARESVYKQVIESKSEIEFEEIIHLPEGKKKYQLRRLFPVQDKNGNIRYIIGYGLDITKRIVAEQKAMDAAKAREHFFAAMSHEIRTPMNAIVGLSRQLSSTPLNEKQKTYVDAINAASDNLLVIINDVLDLSKIDAGKLEPEQIGFDVRKVINNAKNIIAFRANTKKLPLQFEIDDNVAQVLIGDPFRLEQILINLLSNAVKFTYEGTVTLHVSVKDIRAGKQTLMFDVTDTGIGMSEAFLNELFDPFTQEKRIKQHEGTGLGMTISRKLAEAMNGSIQVESELYKGTSVRVLLPFNIGTSNDMPTEKINTGQLRSFTGKTVLVADDNALNRFVATTILEGKQLTVITAEDGLDATEKLRQNPQTQLILMDLQMPGKDGYEATKIIREQIDPSIPIVALSATVLDTEKQKCLDAGMNDFIGKPFEEEEMFDVLAKWLK